MIIVVLVEMRSVMHIRLCLLPCLQLKQLIHFNFLEKIKHENMIPVPVVFVNWKTVI